MIFICFFVQNFKQLFNNSVRLVYNSNKFFPFWHRTCVNLGRLSGLAFQQVCIKARYCGMISLEDSLGTELGRVPCLTFSITCKEQTKYACSVTGDLLGWYGLLRVFDLLCYEIHKKSLYFIEDGLKGQGKWKIVTKLLALKMP